MKRLRLLVLLMMLFTLPAASLTGCRAEGEVDEEGVDAELDT